MLFASSSMHSTRPYLCIEIVFICDTWSLEVTSYNTCKLCPSPSPFPAFWGTEVTGVAFLDLASATESHCLPHGEKQVDRKNQWCSGGPGSLGLCNQVQGRIQNLYKLCSWDCPMLHHDVEESLMTHVYCYIRSQTLKFSKTLSFTQINTSHFKVIFGAQEWVGLYGEHSHCISRCKPHSKLHSLTQQQVPRDS